MVGGVRVGQRCSGVKLLGCPHKFQHIAEQFCKENFEFYFTNMFFSVNQCPREVGWGGGGGLWSPGAPKSLSWSTEPEAFVYVKSGQKC